MASFLNSRFWFWF